MSAGWGPISVYHGLHLSQDDWSSARCGGGNETDLPLVSVIMPVRNESAYIERSLGAVLAQDYPGDLMEIIVADGMSIDGTREIVGTIQVEHSNVSLIDNPGLIAATALNQATAAARGAIIVRVDGHCEISSDYVSNCVRHLVQDGVDGVGGTVETVGESDEARTIAAAMSSWFGVGGSLFRTTQGQTMLTDTIPFPAYTRQIIEAAGPYDEAFVRDQDDEYNYRIRKLGGRLLLAADVRSKYYSRASLASLWSQYYGYGFWKARVLRKHPRQMKARQFVPAVFVAWLGFGLLLAPFSRPVRRLLSLTLVTYGSASVLASEQVGTWTDRRHFLRLPSAFAAIHISYGSGFLLGNAAIVLGRLLKPGSRWRVE